MTQEDLEQLAKEDSLADGYYKEATINSAIHQIGYEAGFKKALELVFKSLGETEEQHSFYQIQELEQQFWNLKS